MHYAAMYGNADVIKLLYHYGAGDSLAMQDHYMDHRTIVSKHENFVDILPWLSSTKSALEATSALGGRRSI